MWLSAKEIRRYVADAGLGTCIALAFGSYVASLATAGVIAMPLAIGFLIVIFIVAMGGTFFLDHLWPFSWRQRVFFGAILLVVLVLTGAYEWTHYEKPLSAQEIADAVANLIQHPDNTPKSEPPKKPAEQADQKNEEPALLQSTQGKMIFLCRSVPRTNQSLEEVRATLAEQLNAIKGTFGLSMEIDDIEGGRAITISPTTPEAKIHMNVASKVVIEMRRANSDLLVTFLIYLPEPLGAISRLIPIEPKSDDMARSSAQIENILGVPRGKCQML
jgi:hypothetical protein